MCAGVCVCVRVLRNYFVCKIMRIAYGCGGREELEEGHKKVHVALVVAMQGCRVAGLRASARVVARRAARFISRCLASHFYCISTLAFCAHAKFLIINVINKNAS